MTRLLPRCGLLLLGYALSTTGCQPQERDASKTSTAWETPTSVPSSTTAPAGSVPSAIASAQVEPAPVVPRHERPIDPDAPIRVVDLHVDTPYQIVQKDRPLSLPNGHATPSGLRAGRYEGIVYPIYIADYLNDNQPRIADADRIHKTVLELVNAHEMLQLAPAPELAEGMVEAFIAIEGAGAFAEDIEQIDRFIDAGIRLVGPVHANDNKLATSATGKDSAKYGLSELGKDFCHRVYERGALVDVSHMSDSAFRDLAAIAEEHDAPIVATHSNARALANHPRNLTDEQLVLIARSGGVAGLNLHSTFVKTPGAPTMADVVAQVLYMVKVAGIDHVAIGSDFDGGRPPDDLADASRLPDLAVALEEAGVEREDLHKIFSRNALRVLHWTPPK